MEQPSAVGLRCLVACGQCQRQYEGQGLAARSRFRCSCGAAIEVPSFRGQDAAVVRCSSCGAPRAKGAASCAHCGADYTLHERDLHTLCPKCMTRISDRARYCHHCATPIAPGGDAGRATDRRCPSCGPRHVLNSRELGGVALLECCRCAGIWLGQEAFDVLAAGARDRGLPEQLAGDGSGAPAPDPTSRRSALYRRCPRCEKMMNRRNYGQRSGVVIDVCKDHGIWFDAHELDAILRFIRLGGEDRAGRRADAEQRHAERLQRIRFGREGQAEFAEVSHGASRGESSLDWLGRFVGSLFDP